MEHSALAGERRTRDFHAWVRGSTIVAAIVVCLIGLARAAGEYPLTLALEAKATAASTTIISTVNIRVDRLMEESRRKRVTDALTYSGYGNFLTALRGIPAVGSIE